MCILLTPLNLYYTFQLLIGGNAVKRIPVVSDMLEILLCLVVRMEECEGVAVEEEPRPPPPDPNKKSYIRHCCCILYNFSIYS